MMMEATFLGIRAGDWLQAVALFLGVGLTILGTLYVERKKRDAGAQGDRAWIAEIAKAIADEAGAIVAGLPADPTNAVGYAKSIAMQTALKSSLDMYRAVRADARVKDIALWRALKTLDEAVADQGPIVDKELRLLADDGHHTAVFNINRANIMTAALPLRDAALSVQALGA